MAQTTASAMSNDQKLFIAAKLISRGYLRLVAKSVCEMEKLPKGYGLVAYFVRYERIQVPLTQLTEGQSDPTPKSATISRVSATMDYWGDIVEATDIALMTTNHSLEDQIAELLSESAQRVIDREVQIVWLAGTNAIFGDGSVTARSSITSSMKLSEALLLQARVQMAHQQAPPRNGPSGVKVESADSARAQIHAPNHYLAVVSPQVVADLQATTTSLGTWAAVTAYQDKLDLYNGEIGALNGFRFVESNFLPVFRLIGNSTAAVTSGNDMDGGSTGISSPIVSAPTDNIGSLTSSTTFFFKVSRKSLLRGFEEEISIAHSMASAATGNTESIKFDFTNCSAGFVWNVYFDTVTSGGTGTDATLGRVYLNQAVGSAVSVLANPAATNTAPANIKASSSNPSAVYVCYLHGAESVSWVGLHDLEFMETADQSIIGNALKLRRQWAYKFYSKSVIRDQTRLLRLEVAATYNPSNPSAS